MSKVCPSCGNASPSYAVLCKHCRYDFKEASTPKKFPLGISVSFLVLGLVALLLTRHLATSHIQQRFVLDVETKSIVIAESTKDGTSVERLPFEKVEKLEHVIGGEEAKYEIVAVVDNGDRLILNKADASLKMSAKAMSEKSGISLVEVNNTRLSID